MCSVSWSKRSTWTALAESSLQHRVSTHKDQGRLRCRSLGESGSSCSIHARRLHQWRDRTRRGYQYCAGGVAGISDAQYKLVFHPKSCERHSILHNAYGILSASIRTDAWDVQHCISMSHVYHHVLDLTCITDQPLRAIYKQQ